MECESCGIPGIVPSSSQRNQTPEANCQRRETLPEAEDDDAQMETKQSGAALSVVPLGHIMPGRAIDRQLTVACWGPAENDERRKIMQRLGQIGPASVCFLPLL